MDKDNPTQVGRALAQLGIELIAAYSPQARGRSERMFGTLQKRLPQELRLAGIATMAEANRFLEELFWPAHNARFARPAADTGSAFVAFAGTLEDILCAQEDRVVAGDNTVRYKNRTLQIPADRHRHHYVKAQVPGARISRRPPGRLPRTQVSGALPRRRRNHRRRQAPGRVTRFDATEPNHHNRSGQFIWYIKRSTQFVIDTMLLVRSGNAIQRDIKDSWPQDRLRANCAPVGSVGRMSGY